MEFLAKLLGSDWTAPAIGSTDSSGTLGGYCRGRDLEECRQVFGNKVNEICATCPN